MKAIREKEMKRKKHNYSGTFMVLLFVVGILLFSGCKKEDNGNAEEETLVPLQIGGVSLNIDEGKGGSSSWTKSGDWDWSGKSIGVFRRNSSGYSGTADNIKYSAGNSEGSSWDPSDNKKQIYLTHSQAKLRAYYPYDSSVGSDGNVTLTSQLYSEDKDLCCQKSDISAAGGSPVSFTMGHVYSRFIFNFTRDASYNGTCTISKVTMENPDIISSDTYNLFTGKTGIPSGGNKGEVTISDVGINSIASGSTSTVYVLMVPSETALSGSFKFTFTVDGKDVMGTVEDASTFGLLAGTQYTFDITIKRLAVEVTNTANCYMIAPGYSLIIPIDVKGNGDANAVAGTGLDVHHTAASVGILWETSPDLISLNGFTTVNQKTEITANDATQTGNAVIAAYSGANQTGDILWSWHIWVTDYNPDSTPVENGDVYTIANTNGSYTWMDRNLGATTASPAITTTMGLLYQWGRKDPFPGAGNYTGISNKTYTSLPIYNENGTVLTEESGTSGTGIKHEQALETTSDKTLNLKNSIKNPMMFYYSSYVSNIGYDWYTTTNDRQYQNDALWGGASNTNSTDKTIFDPCPPGWRVPAWNGDTPWSAFNSTSTFTWTASNYGRTYNGKTLYPAAGYRYCGSGALRNVGSSGYDWSAFISTSTPQYSYHLYFGSGGISVSNSNDRANGFSVRCVKE
ncbi:MAG: fimbrillin family protein [Bacteroidales bacterium]|jgi:hypothetical protein|nr:fimbrillin family protein [Bacteroidales bacterium]